MKTKRMMVAALALTLGAALGQGRVARAEGRPEPRPDTQALAKCLVGSTTEQDQGDLVRWFVASTAQHPAAADLITVTPEQRANMSSRVAIVFERLLTQDCRAQFHDARKSEGDDTVSLSFAILVQTALGDLVQNPTVSSALANIDSYLDKEKIAAAMADVPASTR
ncbi:MAG TPA: hypothetical protein VFQ07_00540 [Candidatus Polarisedimenticolia bacterium]|nr:hypothetical protein [Candidatus Polarisedimenticolia bacterium]